MMRFILFLLVIFGGCCLAANIFCSCRESIWSGIGTVVICLSTSGLAVRIAEWGQNDNH